MAARIRELIGSRKLVPVAVDQIDVDADLYELGMTSFASVQLMLALEEAFDIEFPERMLNRKTFATLAAIDRSVAELTGGRA
ncbi:acyl carrier protein [Siculibacillus lacustris]|uniref:Acyl carrier protein n=1 Tax=Siculibacillus lacustris TaxID=1549641 RepID=A0A4Q9VFY9_9HYPH|nr:acyl carrier protein [Siculibacillus lacustris]TBW33875.1 acyl carrier protein [Siculibacillus lacustris]